MEHKGHKMGKTNLRGNLTKRLLHLILLKIGQMRNSKVENYSFSIFLNFFQYLDINYTLFTVLQEVQRN